MSAQPDAPRDGAARSVEVCGFLPFQFGSAWHERIGLAERIGGASVPGASLIAWPDLRIDARLLLRLSGLAAFNVTQLMAEQDRFGLDAAWSQVGFFTDLHAGPEAYFADLFARDRGLVRDTERCLRKAEKTYGALDFVRPDRIPADMLHQLIAEKRLQYQRTNVADPFVDAKRMRLLDILNNPLGRIAVRSSAARGRRSRVGPAPGAAVPRRAELLVPSV